MGREADDFIHRLTRQAQLLSCLHWLGTFQVPACVPPLQPVAFEDVANMVGVPVSHLARVVRVTATIGFLHEPEPGLVAHTPLSAQFFAKPSLVDAILFLGNATIPAGLQMTEATRLQAQSPGNTVPCAYDLATRLPTSSSSSSGSFELERQAKLHRQLAAYQRLSLYALGDCVTELLFSLDWSYSTDATIVQVGPPSLTTARALAASNPNIRFIVQLYDYPSSSLSLGSDERDDVVIQQRVRGAVQSTDDAAVYIVHFPYLSLPPALTDLRTQFSLELKAHLNALRVNPDAQLILVVQIVPELGTTNMEVEATSRFYDLSLLQMANDEALDMSQLLAMVEEVRDSAGRLVVTDRLCSPHHSLAAFQVKIAPFSDAQG